MDHRLLRYSGIVRGGPWDGQELRAELPVVRHSSFPPCSQYFHENRAWYFEDETSNANDLNDTQSCKFERIP